MLVNRVGDMGLILAMFGILDRFGSLEFSSVFNMVVVSAQSSDITLICFAIVYRGGWEVCTVGAAYLVAGCYGG